MIETLFKYGLGDIHYQINIHNLMKFLIMKIFLTIFIIMTKNNLHFKNDYYKEMSY